mgnify:CR=1 FL=1
MIKRFFKDSALYSLASLFTKGIGFILLPIYTRVLTKEEYGTYDYLNAIGAILTVMVALEISQAILCYVAENQEDENTQAKYIATGFWFTVGCYSLIIVLGYLFRDWLAVLLLDDKSKSEIILISLAVVFSNAMVYLSTLIFRAKLQSKISTLISAVSALFIGSISVLFLLYFEWGLFGLFTGQLVGGVLSFCIACYLLRRNIFHTPSLLKLKEMLVFSAPLVISSIGVVLALFADRVFVKEMLGLDDLAVYSVALRIAGAVSIIVAGFQSALAPLILAHHKDKQTSKDIARLFHIYLVFTLGGVLLLAGAGDMLVLLLAGESYSKSSSLTVVLCAAILIQNGYIFFPGMTLAKKTKLLAVVNIIGACVNLCLNYLLIPILGLYGAAYATLLSALFVLSLNVVCSDIFYPIPKNKLSFPFLLSLVVSLYFIQFV